MRRTLWAMALAGLALTGCGPTREVREQGAWLADRADWLAAHPEWSVSGRLGLSDGERGGSLAFDWAADGQTHRVHLRTLAGGQQWRLEFGPDGARLTGTDLEPRLDPDPDRLVREATGWPIPVRWMTRWLVGMPAPERARLAFAPDGTLEALAVDDWSLDFRRFSVPPGYTVLMPARIEARLPPYRIRAALTGWSFERRDLPASGRVPSDEPLYFAPPARFLSEPLRSGAAR
ncbi:outer membrane lipoprotein LolB [Wenzhouxiangella sp. XN79A]|uniref:outer membrane lipoprotein LolB n=1 Tax=Wenzhouxiangella sp. XN79A TaxID=2724193 RepID=UPI00144AE98C|nr:outer membrane lipoprotein LolB [Wenzhouxiangella sp. XN79A]NKI34137.1 outer membrane lipoprotein LolB [Wenzhouxiangella sp. XN79A]